MARYTFVVLTQPVEGQEDEYNDWYTNTHLGDVLQIPGITAARRYQATDVTPVEEGGHRYCAVYEVEADDLNQIMEELGTRFADGRMKMSDAMQMDPPPSFMIYELI